MESQKFLTFGQPDFGPEEGQEVLDSIAKRWLGTGPKVAQFEKDFIAYKNSAETQHAAALFSATAGLHLSCLAIGLKSGDEVITTPMTFCATVNAIIHAGGTPVLADIDSKTMNISPDEIKRKISPRTKAIIPVHFAGRPCAMDAIMDIAKANKLFVIEDCAHAIETEYKGQKAGCMGDLGVFSFYATKNLAMGEGGLVLSRNEDLVRKIKCLGLHGMSADAWKRFSDDGYKHYDVVAAGFKYNMMDLQAAIGLHQLQKLAINGLKRKKIWEIYLEEFKNLPMELPEKMQDFEKHAYHLFTVLIDEEKSGITRDAFLAAMGKAKLGIGVHYRSIPEHPYYQDRFGWKSSDYPNADRVGKQTVSLPLSPSLTESDVSRVVESVKNIFN